MAAFSAGADTTRRFLFSSLPTVGHARPLLPLATELARRGHEIRFATAVEFAPYVTDHGFDALPVGSCVSAVDALMGTEQFAGRTFHERMKTAAEPDGNIVLGVESYGTDRLSSFYECAKAFVPDAIVHGMYDAAASAAADALRIPSFTQAVGPQLPAATLSAVAKAVAPLWERLGIRPRDDLGLYRCAYFDMWPEALSPTPSDHLDRVTRFSVHSGNPNFSPPAPSIDHVDWRSGLDDDLPSVYVTLGTMEHSAQPKVFEAIFHALGSLPVNVLATVGEHNSVERLRAAASKLPRVHLASFIDQTHVLPFVDAVICQAGAGTILGALTFGRPLVLLPRGADQTLNAAICVAAGVGIALDLRDGIRRTLPIAVRDVLERPSFANRARVLRDEIDRLPPLANAADSVERLVHAWSHHGSGADDG